MNLAAPMPLQTVIGTILGPALAYLPSFMDSDRSRVMLLSIGQQESQFMFRRQMGDGPARGFWQFETGTQSTRGGVWGVFLHSASAPHLRTVCEARKVVFEPGAIWRALEVDDIFACCVARLLLLTDAQALPAVTDEDGSWLLYAERTWRPGKPHPQSWPGYHRAARAALGL